MRRFAAICPVLSICLVLLISACATDPHPGPHRQLVFFEEGSAGLDAQSQAAVNAAAAFVKQHPALPIMVTGYADPVGSLEANVVLSRARAQAVIDALVKAGVPAALITSQARGETQFVATSQESRRVEIAIDVP
jgi:cytochrome c oxidase subunit 2